MRSSKSLAHTFDAGRNKKHIKKRHNALVSSGSSLSGKTGKQRQGEKELPALQSPCILQIALHHCNHLLLTEESKPMQSHSVHLDAFCRGNTHPVSTTTHTGSHQLFLILFTTFPENTCQYKCLTNQGNKTDHGETKMCVSHT